MKVQNIFCEYIPDDIIHIQNNFMYANVANDEVYVGKYLTGIKAGIILGPAVLLKFYILLPLYHCFLIVINKFLLIGKIKYFDVQLYVGVLEPLLPNYLLS